MEDMQLTADLITYLNLLSAEYDLKIDWNTSNIDNKQISFIGGTEEQILKFCLKLDEYCDHVLE